MEVGKGIYGSGGRMVMPRVESAQAVGFPAGAEAVKAAKLPENERAVIELFDQLRNPLLRYAISLGLSPQDGEEVIQEVFLALFRHLQQEKPRSNLRGWVFRVAHNLALKQRALNKRRQATLYSDEGLERQPDATANPEEEAASGQKREKMQAVLRALPEQDRCCLYLRAEGLRYREIAAALGISLGSVSNALTRSLARLARVDRGLRNG